MLVAQRRLNGCRASLLIEKSVPEIKYKLKTMEEQPEGA